MKYLLLTAALIFGAFAMPGVSYADTDIDVVFQGETGSSTSLFGETNFIPGDTVSKTVTVTNDGDQAEDVYTELVNETGAFGDNPNELAGVIDVEITGGTPFLDTLAGFRNYNFLSIDAGKVPLGSINPGQTIVYTYKMTFQPAAGNEYQNQSLGFDLCIGFEGGQFECDDFENDDDPDDGPDDTPDNPGGGGDNGDDDGPSGSRSGPDDGEGGGDVGEPEDTFVPFIGGVGGGFPFEDLVGEILGENVSADEGATTTGEEPEGLVAQASASGANFINAIDCTLFWLILLAVISMSWSLIEDRLGKRAGLFGPFFIRHAIFTVGYVIGLVIFHLLNILEMFWFVFAGAWVVMVGLDYWSHKQIADFWSAHRRNFYYGALALVFAALGLFTALLCVWIPFVIIMLISTVLFFLDD